MSRDALNLLTRHAWPGNVRELQNEIRRALALGDSPVLGAELLSPRVRQKPSPCPIRCLTPLKKNQGSSNTTWIVWRPN